MSHYPVTSCFNLRKKLAVRNRVLDRHPKSQLGIIISQNSLYISRSAQFLLALTISITLIAAEMLNEDSMDHPCVPHAFAIPGLMTHFWRKQLGRDANIVFWVKREACFWPSSMHEALCVLIILPICHVPNYRGPSALCGSPEVDKLSGALGAGFKEPRANGRQQFHDLDGAHA